jgi:hypothetical protein
VMAPEALSIGVTNCRLADPASVWSRCSSPTETPSPSSGTPPSSSPGSVAVRGIALPGGNMHGPNEWIPWYQLERGMKTMTRLYGEVSR